jgi:hypothetical protein
VSFHVHSPTTRWSSSSCERFHNVLDQVLEYLDESTLRRAGRAQLAMPGLLDNHHLRQAQRISARFLQGWTRADGQ